MLGQLLNLFEVTEERADELFLMFLDGEDRYQDTVVATIMDADVPQNEKMLMCYVLGVLSLIEVQEKSIFTPRKQYIH